MMNTNIRLQSLKNKKGEVNFRKKLALQHTDGTIVFEDEPTKSEKVRELETRIEKTRKIFTNFTKKKIRLSPFFEIAAGEGFRSDVLETEFNAQGIASDISAETLLSGFELSQSLELTKQSIKICCDAYNLPIRSDSFPFVFIAMSLHHFPDPKPIISEAYRILSKNGFFFVDEEPITQHCNLNLWRRGFKLRWWEKILKGLLLLPFLSRIGKTETAHDILEESFSLTQWQDAFTLFETVTATLFVYPYSLGIKAIQEKEKKAQWIFPHFAVRTLLFFFGGGIQLLAQKKSGNKSTIKLPIEALGCPNCRNGNNLAPLIKTGENFSCTKCNHIYPYRNGVHMLLTSKLYTELYE